MTRAFLLFSLIAVVLVAAGCDGQNQARTNQVETPGGSRGISLYPLSTPPPAAAQPLQAAPAQYSAQAPGYVTPYSGITYQTTAVPPATAYPTTYSTGSAPGYCPPTYCPPPETQSYTPTTLVIPDPPVVIDNVYYPSTTGVTTYGASYSTTTTYATGTYAAPSPSPYDSLRTYQTGSPAPYASYTASSYTATTGPQVVTYPATTTTTTYTAPYSAPMTPEPVTTAYTVTTAPTYSTTPLVPTYGTPETVAAMTSPLTTAVGTFQLVPAPDIPPRSHPNDAGPSQWFEILRPGNGAIRIGRVSSTCVCVGVRVPNRHIAAGERALIEARTLTRPPVRNVTYGIYVNVEEPEKTVLDADVTIP